LQVGQQIRCGAKQDAVARFDRRVGDVFGDHCFAQAIGADQNQVTRFDDEIQSQGALDQFAINLPGPVPIEVKDRFEAADSRLNKQSLETPGRLLGGLSRGDLLKQRSGGELIARGPGNR